ncbi:MAG: phosphate ABC transporter permease subunit PstC [Caldilinea sp.]|nr:phosphate ABC transporter permease subunit PstC [Caldilinea sp.]MDW8442048.1 phosphate ABC transporter permease subunit PstC [Caldilineaceae bacterium]
MTREESLTLLTQAGAVQSGVTMQRRRLFDVAVGAGMRMLQWLVILLLLMMTATLSMRSLPILRQLELLRSHVWQPMAGRFGLAPFIAGSMAVTAVAMALATIPAILCGVYMAEYTSTRTRAWLKPLLDLLVGVPSVVYGLWGVLFVVPLIRDRIGPAVDATLGQMLPFFRQTNPSGYGVLAAGVVLALMTFPLIVAVTEEVMRSAPQQMRETLLALGATRWETTKCIVRHAALPGVMAAVVLGFSRAFGETLAVMMVVGNAPRAPTSIFDAAYPLPALIANNYSEMMSVPLYDSALMMAALFLLVVVLCFNVMARLVIHRLTRQL